MIVRERVYVVYFIPFNAHNDWQRRKRIETNEGSMNVCRYVNRYLLTQIDITGLQMLQYKMYVYIYICRIIELFILYSSTHTNAWIIDDRCYFMLIFRAYIYIYTYIPYNHIPITQTTNRISPSNPYHIPILIYIISPHMCDLVSLKQLCYSVL